MRDCCRIFAAVKILASISNDFVIFEYVKFILSIIPAIDIGILFAFINNIESSNWYWRLLLATNSWLLFAFNIDKLKSCLLSLAKILSRS